MPKAGLGASAGWQRLDTRVRVRSGLPLPRKRKETHTANSRRAHPSAPSSHRHTTRGRPSRCTRRCGATGSCIRARLSRGGRGAGRLGTRGASPGRGGAISEGLRRYKGIRELVRGREQGEATHMPMRRESNLRRSSGSGVYAGRKTGHCGAAKRVRRSCEDERRQEHAPRRARRATPRHSQEESGPACARARPPGLAAD